MASTWSNLGLRLMTTGENSNAWGDQTNYNWNRMEDASDGYATLAVTGNHTLTFTTEPTSYADENGRNKVIVFTGSAGGTRVITFPDIEKTYFLLNDSDSTLTLTSGTGATTASLAAGKDMAIYVDGSDEVHNALANLATTSLTSSGVITGGTVEATTDTAAGDNAAMGYTSAEGLILTGQGSTNDVTIKNDADADVLEIPTGTTNVTVVGSFTSGAGGAVGAQGTATSLAGIPFFYGDTGSIYTHDVSGTDSTAQYNTAYGLTALDAITTGDNNTAIGYGAGSALQDGDGNVCVGTGAGNDITSGANNVAIGQDALAQTTTTDGNIAIGRNALQLPDTEAHNIAIGHTTMSGAVAGGEYNIAIGGLALDAAVAGDYNVVMGYQAASALTSGTQNVFIGYQAGKDATTSDGNTVVGRYAGGAGGTMTGNENVFIGNSAGAVATSAVSNVFVGASAGAAITTSTSCTFVGYQAGDGHDAENYNVAIGRDSLGGSVNGGEYNVAVGNNTLMAATSADNNTAVGYNAGVNVSTGGNNTIIGFEAGKETTTGANNVFLGKDAGKSHTTSSQNVLIGANAGESITTGGDNIMIGREAGDGYDTESHNIGIGTGCLGGSIAGGQYNTAVGTYALTALTAGDSNNAHGYNCARRLTTGNFNNFYGEQAGDHVTGGNHNTGIGYSTMGGEATCTGSENTAIGNYAGWGITTGASNTTLGYDCAHNISTGSNNIAIGVDAGVTGSPGGNITTQNNYILFGDENITESNIQVDWTVASDQRDKTDFTALDIGLDFVNDLKPYTYKWDKRIKYVSDEDRDTIDLDTITHDGTHKEDWLDIGFKAQDVEALEDAAGYKIAEKTNLTTSLTGDGKQYGIKYSNFVPILVKAVQELSATVTTLQQEVNTLKGE